MGAAMERLAAHERRRLAGDTDGQQHLALSRAFAHGVGAITGAIEGVVGIDVTAVGAMEQALAKAAQEISLAVQHHHRMFATVEDINAILAVDRDGGDVGQVPAVRQLRPVLYHAGALLARAEDGWHMVLPNFLVCCPTAFSDSIRTEKAPVWIGNPPLASSRCRPR